MTKKWECLLAGRLALKEELLEGQEPVFINNNDAVQFLLKVQSYGPEDCPTDELFTCWGNKIERFGFEDDSRLYEPVRTDKLVKLLQDKIILFKPSASHSGDGRIHYIAEPKALLDRPAEVDSQTKLLPLLLAGFEGDALSEALLERKTLGRFQSYPREMPQPIAVVDSCLAQVYGPVAGLVSRRDELTAIIQEPLRKAPFPSQFAQTALIYENLILLAENVAQKLEKELKEGQEVTAPDSGQIVHEAGSPVEVRFLEDFHAFTRSAGFLYSKEDMENLHLAFKCGSLVLLAGMTGIGKSQLVRLYGKMLGLGERFLMLPVSPTWHEDADLIGYLDTLNMLYRPSTELVDLLLAAQANPEALYLICFDEMNLARPEHYFAQFLSVLEAPAEERYLTLYNPKLQSRVYNSGLYPAKVRIGDNVLFAGTINVDESTYAFSDKLLDRANVISLQLDSFTELARLVPCQAPRIYPVSAGSYNGWRYSACSGLSLRDSELAFFEELQAAFEEVDLQRGFGYRVLRQIDCYLANLPQMKDWLTRGEALDLQVEQRILPKLRGPKEQWEALIGRLKGGELADSLLEKVFNQYPMVSDFSRSRSALKRKAKELGWYGYAS
jgi:energy-coupling factor transporter ATP-binding protein EcfA2